jgi:DNA-binding transcriptional ArsR family regulator
MNNQFYEIADILKTIGHPIRISILKSLLEQEKCVSGLGESLHLRQSTVSQHLSLLRGKGIVADERQGTMVKYSVSDKRIVAMLKMLATW